ncbi:hypothetical protein O181_026984 [Austropuccinia psidii MF-1]|uniref:Uncharacterized protein n=1 Tax=Austropuccinia psidii MF-1 TaxID=1389203 RepID=A0A9Q3H259_9BASI|nr:hypothetical protein [Austropuccinia psidii MF-1]
MSYSEKEVLRPLPEASSWPKFSGTGEYDHMKHIDHIDGLFIDVPSIPDYWITARLNTAFKVMLVFGTCILQKTISFENDQYSVEKDPYEWCFRQYKGLEAIYPQLNIQMRNQKLLTEIPGELKHEVKCRFNQCFTLYDIANTLQDVRKRTNIGENSQFRSSSFKEKQNFRVDFKDKPKEKMAEVANKNNSCHNCGSTDHYANNFTKEKKKVYAIYKVLEEKSPAEEFEAESMGDAIREHSNDDQDPREAFIVEYQEETQI